MCELHQCLVTCGHTGPWFTCTSHRNNLIKLTVWRVQCACLCAQSMKRNQRKNRNSKLWITATAVPCIEVSRAWALLVHIFNGISSDNDTSLSVNLNFMCELNVYMLRHSVHVSIARIPRKAIWAISNSAQVCAAGQSVHFDLQAFVTSTIRWMPAAELSPVNWVTSSVARRVTIPWAITQICLLNEERIHSERGHLGRWNGEHPAKAANRSNEIFL